MTAYALWLDLTTTPPTATVAALPAPLHKSNKQIGAIAPTQPTPNARCVGTLIPGDGGTGLSSLRWTPVL